MVARATTDAIWDWDIASDRVWWSEGMRTPFGFVPEETAFDRSAWMARIHEDDRDRVVASMQTAIDSALSVALPV